jgi:hypothetical protein
MLIVVLINLWLNHQEEIKKCEKLHLWGVKNHEFKISGLKVASCMMYIFVFVALAEYRSKKS